MISFVNIKTEEFFLFESWDQITQKGGLKNCLPEDQWHDIWEEKACKESPWGIIKETLSHSPGHYSKFKLEDCILAMKLFDKLAFSRLVSTPP